MGRTRSTISFLEYRKVPGGRDRYRPNGADAAELLERAGFTDVRWQTLEIAIAVPDGETYWRFTRSHGAGAAINGLPDDKRAELHDRLVAAVDAAGGTTLRRSAALASPACRAGGPGPFGRKRPPERARPSPAA